MRSIVLFTIVVSVFFSCAVAAQVKPGNSAYVFKSKHDCGKYVLVGLSPDGRKVIWVPRPVDVNKNVPKQLVNDYWVSSQNVSVTTAVLAITRAEYAKMVHAQPTADDLYFLITEKRGITEVWDCSTAGDEKVLRNIVKEGRLKSACKVVK
ncbi:MAG: hypothetical protein IAE95_10305 [Chitinophagaceae bacterium]|nr:hypothetical protein [Chitinophagaceae bacterium]